MKSEILLIKIRRLTLSKAVINEFRFFGRIKKRYLVLAIQEEISSGEIS
ncbi:MAG: hypothetical protein KDD52_10240 [Bdellovibrionales bacterium]|nr:hypothetical protein [Bdellovibrionales bacterium]